MNGNRAYPSAIEISDVCDPLSAPVSTLASLPAPESRLTLVPSSVPAPVSNPVISMNGSEIKLRVEYYDRLFDGLERKRLREQEWLREVGRLRGQQQLSEHQGHRLSGYELVRRLRC